MKKIIFFILFAYISGISYSQTGWKLKKNSDGIKVYTRTTDNSNICEFKATTEINTSISKILKIICAANDYPSWVNQVSYSKLISKNSKHFVVYYQIDLPIGLKNRDIVIDNKISQNTNDKIRIDLKSASNLYPKQKRFYRITKAYGYWLLTAKNGKSVVTYQFYSNPEANFPAAVMNLFLVDGPYKTLKKLKSKFE